jgi:hypothetical protein
MKNIGRKIIFLTRERTKVQVLRGKKQQQPTHKYIHLGGGKMCGHFLKERAQKSFPTSEGGANGALLSAAGVE